MQKEKIKIKQNLSCSPYWKLVGIDRSGTKADVKTFVVILGSLLFYSLPQKALGALEFLQNIGNVNTDLNTLYQFIEGLTKFSIQWVLAIALIALMITGYKYVTSAVNPQTAEQAKKSFLYILFGVLIVLGFYGFLQAIKAFIS